MAKFDLFRNVVEGIDQALCESLTSTASTLSSLRSKLLEVSQKIGFDVDIIVNWIHLFANSRSSAKEQFILNVIDDHDVIALGARINADDVTLMFFDTFYSSERLMPYKMAHRWFRDLWFRNFLIYSLTDDASKWLEGHRRKKRKGWLDGIRWSDRPFRNAYVSFGGPC
jgi:hypothetical protein